MHVYMYVSLLFSGRLWAVTNNEIVDMQTFKMHIINMFLCMEYIDTARQVYLIG